MPSFSSLFTDLTGAGFYYEKSSHHATYNFNQEAPNLYRQQPRFPFEYYINIALNNVPATANYINTFFNAAQWQQIAPIVKTVEMPSFKIETTPINEYNRKRLSQTKIINEPVKVVFHDVCDGKTLSFWEMYYRYYFLDGNEPGKNLAAQNPNTTKKMTAEQFLNNITPAINPNLANLPSSILNAFQAPPPTSAQLPYNTVGTKEDNNNILANTMNNHLFGFNLPQVGNQRNLINSIEIYQVHAGRFNQVVLVNPRISAFTHDVLNYAGADKTLELTFTFEYEYAYYIIQNMQLNNPVKGYGGQTNNDSTITQYTHGEFLDLPALAFTSQLNEFLEQNNPLLQSSNPILSRIGQNTQTALTSVVGAFSANTVRTVSASALNGLANISPTPYHPQSSPTISTRPFGNNAVASPTPGYVVANPTGGGSSG
jgi:hypothetical protein